MHNTFRRSLPLLFCLVTFVGVFAGLVTPVHAADDFSWTNTGAPNLVKTSKLPENTLPDSRNIDCTPATYFPFGQLTEQKTCTFTSSLGQISTDGKLFTGRQVTADVYGPHPSYRFLSTVDPSIALVTVSSGSYSGDYLGIYHGLTRSSLRLGSNQYGPYYSVPKEPDTLVKNKQTNTPLNVNTTSVAFSSNGDWMVVNVDHTGLMRVDMRTLDTKLFSSSLEQGWEWGLKNPQLAISNDGRYVASDDASSNDPPRLKMYDLSTCEDQLNSKESLRKYCTNKDIWNGQNAQGIKVDGGIAAQWSGLVRPTQLRFVSGDNLSFNAIYEKRSNLEYQAGSFVVTAQGGKLHRLGLLGMGDSYISGQGTFSYREGTDTPNNGCHLSELSYPFILGRQNFDSYNSIACSGALVRDLVNGDATYKGQVIDKIEQGSRSNKQEILDNFLPGYLNQKQFTDTYRPSAIVLSIGGNDINFADIVGKCAGAGSCYSSKEDVVEITGRVDRARSGLRETYRLVKEKSGGARVYVVGYPQITRSGGYCGLNVHLDSYELKLAEYLIGYLNRAIEETADEAGVFYVNAEGALDGYRLCEAPKGQAAINGVTAGSDVGIKADVKFWESPDKRQMEMKLFGNESFHPTKLGHELLAKTVAAKTQNLTAQMPTPGAYKKELLPFPEGIPSTGRPLNVVTFDDSIASDMLLQGDSQHIVLNGTDVQLQMNSQYQIVFHSEPVTAYTGMTDAAGNIDATYTVPASLEPGFHTLHIYGKNMAGENIDIQKVVYVAASETDYDGDGVPNSVNQCLIFPMSGVDEDKDGVDDACDGVVDEPPVEEAKPEPVQTSTQHSKIVSVTTAATKVVGATATLPFPIFVSPLLASVNSTGAAEVSATATESTPQKQRISAAATGQVKGAEISTKPAKAPIAYMGAAFVALFLAAGILLAVRRCRAQAH